MEVEQDLALIEDVDKQLFDNFVEQANDNNKLPIELTNTTGTHLDQHVNDDCLLEIFSVKSLTLIDLCSIAETCERFQQIVRRVVPKTLEIRYSSHRNYDVTSTNYSHSENLISDDIKRILKNFGSFLSEMSILIRLSSEEGRSFASNFLLNMIARYCADTLLRLNIDGLNIHEINLKRLRYLQIEYSTIIGDSPILTNFKSLQVLRLHMVKNCNVILKNVFPKLKRFYYEYLDSKKSFKKTLSTFFSRHTHLKKIGLNGDFRDRCVIIVMQAIANSCTELNILRLRIRGRRTTNTASLPLQELKSLQLLKLYQVSFENFEFIPILTELRELHLYWCNLPNDSNQFDFLIQLTKLYLYLSSDSIIDVVDVIVKRLINLDILEVCEYGPPEIFVLDEKTFTKIVGIVKGRPKILTLKCKFNFNHKNCDNENVRLIKLNDF